MELEILTFGQISDIIGKSSIKLSHINNTDELINNLSQQFPELKNTRYIVAVNKHIAHQNIQLNPGDVVALLPPFSGG
jgi:molybdopterin synthase sulfur carrier subunit